VNLNKLRGKIVENELNVSKLATSLGIDRSTLYRKLNEEGDKLTIKEANQIVDILHLSKEEAMSIFFKHLVA
jgi:DNA-binding phage protein